MDRGNTILAVCLLFPKWGWGKIVSILTTVWSWSKSHIFDWTVTSSNWIISFWLIVSMTDEHFTETCHPFIPFWTSILSVVVHSDRQEKVVDIRQNIHESIYDLVTNLSTLEPPVCLADDANEISASYIRNLGPDEPLAYTQVSWWWTLYLICLIYFVCSVSCPFLAYLESRSVYTYIYIYGWKSAREEVIWNAYL
jgi:hypothetical protein